MPDAGAGRHRPVLGEGRLELGQCLDRRAGPDIFVLVDHDVALAGLDREGQDLVLEPTGLLGRLGLVLRRDREAVLVLAAELPLRGDVLRRIAHVIAVEGIHQAVLEHRVDELEVAHLGARAQMRRMLGHRHGFLAAGHDDGRIAVGDLLEAERDRPQSAAAELVQPPGRLLLRHARRHGGLPGRVLPLPGGEDLAQNDLVDFGGIDLGALEGALDRRGAELVRRSVGEGAVEGPDRRPGGADDDDIGRHGCSLGLMLTAWPVCGRPWPDDGRTRGNSESGRLRTNRRDPTTPRTETRTRPCLTRIP